MGQQKPQLLWWKARIGEYTLADLTPGLIAKCRDQLEIEILPNGRKLERWHREPLSGGIFSCFDCFSCFNSLRLLINYRSGSMRPVK